MRAVSQKILCFSYIVCNTYSGYNHYNQQNQSFGERIGCATHGICLQLIVNYQKPYEIIITKQSNNSSDENYLTTTNLSVYHITNNYGGLVNAEDKLIELKNEFSYTWRYTGINITQMEYYGVKLQVSFHNETEFPREVQSIMDRINKFGSMQKDNILTDVVFSFDDGNQVRAHSQLLAAASEYFETFFQSNTKDAKSKRINLGQESCEYFQLFIQFLYTGKLKCEEHHYPALYILADRYNVKDLYRAILNQTHSVKNVDDLIKCTRTAWDFKDNDWKASLMTQMKARVADVKNSEAFYQLIRDDYVELIVSLL